MMLAIETSTDACSVALGDGARSHVDHRVAPRQHNRLVLPMIDALLVRAGVARADLSALAIGRGPGSFTGVRIAASIAQGLALALDVPVACVSTLEVLALGALRATPAAAGVVAAIDTTASQRYIGAFEVRNRRLTRAVEDVAVATTAPLPACVANGWLAVGPNVEALVEQARARGIELIASGVTHPSAAELLELGLLEIAAGRGVDAQHALPVYLDGDGPWRKRARS